MSTARRVLGACALGVALALSASGCGGDELQEADRVDVPAYDTPQEAYAAVVEAYVDDDCDTAAALVDGTARGVDQFVSGCEQRENVEVIGSIEVTGEPRSVPLDELPDAVTEAVRLTAAFTAESGEPTDYYPDMVRIDGRWKLWLPGDAPQQSPPPAIESSAPATP